MTQDEIIEMGLKAGLCDKEGRDDNSIIITDHMERFANLVAAKEREACAKIAERFEPDEKTSYVTYASIAIRARGE